MRTSNVKRKLMAGLAAGALAVFGVAACEVEDGDFDDDLMEEPADDTFEDDAGDAEGDDL